MDTERLRESSDEQEEHNEQDDQEDNIENVGKDVNEAEVNSNKLENGIGVNRKSSKHSKNNSRSVTPQKQTRLLNQPNRSKRSWKSANAFINFVQDFKKEYPDMIMGRNIFQICGERWKNMTDDQKQPYIVAANSVKKSKHRKSVGEVCDQQVKKSVTRVSKRKAETKRKETTQKRSKANIRDPKSNSDTDTATTTVHSSMSDADSL